MTHSTLTAGRSRRSVILGLAAVLSLPFASSAMAQTPAAVPPMNGVAHIALRVKDIADSVAFYNKLGFVQAFSMNKGDVVTQSFIKINDKQFIELYPIAPTNPTQDKPEFLHLCFEGVDLNAIHDYYVAQGLTPIAVRTAGAGNLLFTMKGPQQWRDPQNIEYTQYMPASMHSKDVGQHLSPERVADKMKVVTITVQQPAVARDYYIDKMGFTSNSKDVMLLDLPGSSGEQVQLAGLDPLGSKSSIVMTTPDLAKSEAHLNLQGVKFTKGKGSATITDPDGNIIRIDAAR